jgi:hypothetical protein
MLLMHWETLRPPPPPILRPTSTKCCLVLQDFLYASYNVFSAQSLHVNHALYNNRRIPHSCNRFSASNHTTTTPCYMAAMARSYRAGTNAPITIVGRSESLAATAARCFLKLDAACRHLLCNHQD